MAETMAIIENCGSSRKPRVWGASMAGVASMTVSPDRHLPERQSVAQSNVHVVIMQTTPRRWAYRFRPIAARAASPVAGVHLGEEMELDPEIRAFAEESDRLFGPDYGRLPIAEQRRLYNAWCQHF